VILEASPHELNAVSLPLFERALEVRRKSSLLRRGAQKTKGFCAHQACGVGMCCKPGIEVLVGWCRVQTPASPI
jgi:hypothetical protein